MCKLEKLTRRRKIIFIYLGKVDNAVVGYKVGYKAGYKVGYKVGTIIFIGRFVVSLRVKGLFGRFPGTPIEPSAGNLAEFPAKPPGPA